jgi:DmsE family decaheme c-type cytochrome
MTKHNESLSVREKFAHSYLPRLVGMLALLFACCVSAQQSGQQPDPQQTPGFTENGIDSCLLCHDVERMRLIAHTPHGKRDNPDTPFAKHGCESCHGPGSLHASRSRRGKGRPPMTTFGAGTNTPATKQTAACLACHDKDMGELEKMEWTGSTHAIAELEGPDGVKSRLSCSSCHEIHVTDNPLEDQKTQAEACYRCHEKMKAQHPKFEDKGINIDNLTCWDCHDVHQLIPENAEQATR